MGEKGRIMMKEEKKKVESNTIPIEPKPIDDSEGTRVAIFTENKKKAD